MSATAQYDLLALLEQAGARPRGNRHDCPKCDGFRTITHSAEAFFCHKCQWKGNAVSLAKELGVYLRLSPAEYRTLCQERERVDDAARTLYEQVKTRRFEVLDGLHTLNRLEVRAHDAGLDHPATWGALEMVYRDRPALLAELAILENCRAADLLRFLAAGKATRGRVIASVIERGGLTDVQDRFVEVGGA